MQFVQGGIGKMKVQNKIDNGTKILILENHEDICCVITTLVWGVNEKLERLRYNIKKNNEKRIEEISSEVSMITKLISDLGYSPIIDEISSDLEKLLNENKKRTLI